MHIVPRLLSKSLLHVDPSNRYFVPLAASKLLVCKLPDKHMPHSLSPDLFFGFAKASPTFAQSLLGYNYIYPEKTKTGMLQKKLKQKKKTGYNKDSKIV